MKTDASRLCAPFARKRYTAVYPASATYLCSAVIPRPDSDGQQKAFVSESKLYYHDTDSPEEADYLAAVLNSPHLDAELKPLQSKGDFGPRDIHKKMWAFPIPSYDVANVDHRKLAALGAECPRAVEDLMASLPEKQKQGSIGRLRGLIREKLKDHLSAIDDIVGAIL